MSKAIIKLDHIDITFHQKKRTIEAVKGVTVHINQGDIYGIVGYSGAGKSTLVRVINLLQTPTKGKITVDQDVIFENGEKRLSSQELRKKRHEIGMIFQHFNLMAQKTARQNVAFALRHSNLSAAQKESKVTELLELVGLTDRAENYPSQLSGGQKQRVAIARSLITNPQLLLADEPTAALDYRNSEDILNLFEDINSYGQTLLMVTHSANAASHAKRVLFIKDGRIFHQIYRGNKTNQEFSKDISLAMTALLGGE